VATSTATYDIWTAEGIVCLNVDDVERILCALALRFVMDVKNRANIALLQQAWIGLIFQAGAAWELSPAMIDFTLHEIIALALLFKDSCPEKFEAYTNLWHKLNVQSGQKGVQIRVQPKGSKHA
jgi:hypothetical protein